LVIAARTILKESSLPASRLPYSDEYRELKSNPALLETLATLTNGSVNFWKSTPDGRIDMRRTIDAVDHFRRDPALINPRAFSDLWPLLLWLAAILFLFDVAVRRIAPDVDRISAPWPISGRSCADRKSYGHRIYGEASQPEGGSGRATRPLARRDSF